MITEQQKQTDDVKVRSQLVGMVNPTNTYIAAFSESHICLGDVKISTRGSYEKLLQIVKAITDAGIDCRPYEIQNK